MKAGWHKAKIVDVARVQSGSGFPTRYQGEVGEAIPFYKVSDMNLEGNESAMVYENNSVTEDVKNELGASIFPAGSVIFPKIGGAIATNKKRLTTKDCCVDNNVMGIIPRLEKIDSEFLYYFFLGHDLSEFANKAHLPSIKKTVVEEWVMCLPKAISEQRRIVGILDEAFAGVAAAKANAEKNLQNAGTLFGSHLQAIFTQGGHGYTNKALGEVCDLFQGLAINAKSKHLLVAHSSLPLLRIKDLRNNTAEQFVAETGYPPNARVDESEIIYTRTGQIGLVFRGRVGVLHNNCFKVRPKHDLNVDYLFWWLQSPTFRDRIINLAKRAAQPDITHSVFKVQRILVPPLDRQEQAAKSILELSEETQRLESLYRRKLAALDELKKSLLHQAFSGQL